MKELYPDSRLRTAKRVQNHVGANWIPIFCANCGCDYGYVPEENCNFAFALCQECADSLPPIEGTYEIPDEVFWRKVNDAQNEKYGRLLNPLEIAKELENPESMLSKLKKEGN